jgi:enoyl-CoA hydratase/carnithine racemase
VSEPLTQFKLARVERPDAAGPIAVVTIDNGADHTQPTFFGRGALESLEAVLDELERGGWAALVVTGKPFFFSAGADVKEFAGASAELGREGSRRGHELFGRIRALPFPTVAAVNGVCLGGGVELALHCDARTISTAVRHFACPECFLGIVPGWGGTQLVPRLVGVETAVTFIVENPLRQNRMLDGPKAFELGFADALLEPAEFLDESIAWLLRTGPRDSPPDTAAPDSAEEVIRKARARVDDHVHGAAPAPYVALDLIDGSTRWSLDEGYGAEEDAIAELLPGPQAQASIYAFDLVERRAKRALGNPDAESARIDKVGIVGAGVMASQIAAVVLRRLEVPIVLRDVSGEIVDRALESIRGELAAQAAKGRYEDGKARFLGREYRLWYSRQAGGEIKSGCFAQDARGRWYLNLQVEVEERDDRGTGEVGIDLGLSTLATLSTGEKIENPRHIRRHEEVLAKAQRAGNKRRARAIHAKIANCRRHNLHEVTTHFARSYRRVVVGNVSAARLARTRMAKSVLDAGWSKLRTMLRYKLAMRRGAEYAEADERYSSQVCSACGARSGPKGIAHLGVRTWECGDCGVVHGRDHNAALNILSSGWNVGLHEPEILTL